jgi:hypothetical protein
MSLINTEKIGRAIIRLSDVINDMHNTAENVAYNVSQRRFIPSLLDHIGYFFIDWSK